MAEGGETTFLEVVRAARAAREAHDLENLKADEMVEAGNEAGAEAAAEAASGHFETLQQLNLQIFRESGKVVSLDDGDLVSTGPSTIPGLGLPDGVVPAPDTSLPRYQLELAGTDTTEMDEAAVDTAHSEYQEAQEAEQLQAAKDLFEHQTGEKWADHTPDEIAELLDRAAELEMVGGREGFEALTGQNWDGLDAAGRKAVLDEAGDLQAVGGREGFEALTGQNWDGLDAAGRKAVLDEAGDLQAVGGREGFEALTGQNWDDLDSDQRKVGLDQAAEDQQADQQSGGQYGNPAMGQPKEQDDPWAGGDDGGSGDGSEDGSGSYPGGGAGESDDGAGSGDQQPAPEEEPEQESSTSGQVLSSSGARDGSDGVVASISPSFFRTDDGRWYNMDSEEESEFISAYMEEGYQNGTMKPTGEAPPTGFTSSDETAASGDEEGSSDESTDDSSDDSDDDSADDSDESDEDSQDESDDETEGGKEDAGDDAAGVDTTPTGDESNLGPVGEAMRARAEGEAWERAVERQEMMQGADRTPVPDGAETGVGAGGGGLIYGVDDKSGDEAVRGGGQVGGFSPHDPNYTDPGPDEVSPGQLGPEQDLPMPAGSETLDASSLLDDGEDQTDADFGAGAVRQPLVSDGVRAAVPLDTAAAGPAGGRAESMAMDEPSALDDPTDAAGLIHDPLTVMERQPDPDPEPEEDDAGRALGLMDIEGPKSDFDTDELMDL